jgi:hypothetical protein
MPAAPPLTAAVSVATPAPLAGEVERTAAPPLPPLVGLAVAEGAPALPDAAGAGLLQALSAMSANCAIET